MNTAMENKSWMLWGLVASVVLTGCGGGGDEQPPSSSPTVKIEAFNDSLTVESGKAASVNLLTNDKWEGGSLNVADVMFVVVTSNLPPAVSVGASGLVSVASAAPEGTYSLGYRICQKTVASNCTSANATVVVSPPQAISVADALQKAEQSGAIPVLNRDNTISGVDTDNNGVRDDVDRYIQNLPDTTTQKSALTQASSALTVAMTVNTADQNAVVATSNAIAAAAVCVVSQYENPLEADKRHRDIEKITINTLERLKAYQRYSLAINGSSFVLPQEGACHEN